MTGDRTRSSPRGWSRPAVAPGSRRRPPTARSTSTASPNRRTVIRGRRRPRLQPRLPMPARAVGAVLSVRGLPGLRAAPAPLTLTEGNLPVPRTTCEAPGALGPKIGMLPDMPMEPPPRIPGRTDSWCPATKPCAPVPWRTPPPTPSGAPCPGVALRVWRFPRWTRAAHEAGSPGPARSANVIGADLCHQPCVFPDGRGGLCH
jgi:hypothetical protein